MRSDADCDGVLDRRLQRGKADKGDAPGLAYLVRSGWYRPEELIMPKE
jgi:hypothetical protein